MISIFHHSHYNDGSIEVIDYINDKKFNFNLGNAIKYISKAGKKDSSKYIGDLQKDIYYIQYEINKYIDNEGNYYGIHK